MLTNPISWFEIYVDDLCRAQRFYQAVFDLQLSPLNDPNDSGIQMLAFPSQVNQYGATGALVKMEGISAGGNSTIIYFSCQDCAVEQARVCALGGQIQQTKMAIGEYGFIALVIDSEGNMIGLHSMN